MNSRLEILPFMLLFLLPVVATAQVNTGAKPDKPSSALPKPAAKPKADKEEPTFVKDTDENSSTGSGTNRAIVNPCNATTPPLWCN